MTEILLDDTTPYFGPNPHVISSAHAREIGDLIREFHRHHKAAWAPLLARESESESGFPISSHDRNQMSIEAELAEEAGKAVAEWLDEHMVREPLLCDGLYYLADANGDMAVVNPEVAIDITGMVEPTR
jgi:hypothetical protein